MIEAHRRKRNFAILLSGLLMILAFLLGQLWFWSVGGLVSFEALGRMYFFLQPVAMFLGFKVCYHWAKAKGYDGTYTLWALANIIGAYVLYRLPDRTQPPKLKLQIKAVEERTEWAAVDKFD